VAVRGDTILAVGDSGSIVALIGPSTEVLHNGGAMIVPGLIDDHTHFMSGGFQLASVDLRDAASPEEFTARIKAHAAILQPGEWITGGDWDHELWPEAGLPQRDWIDSVTPNNPVFVSRLDGHMGLANTLALELAGISAHTADVPGGVMVRYPGGREPTGLLKDNAMDPLWDAIPDASPSQRDSALARAMQHAASKGVTAISEMDGRWWNWAAYRRARDAGALTLRVAFHHPLSDWRGLADSLAALGPGDDWLWLGGAKGFVDGSLGSSTALFDQPYSDDSTTVGTLTTSEDSLRAWIGGADSAGIQLAIHAIGDRAIALLLDIFDSVATAHGPRDRRLRVEHAQHLRPDDFARFAELGVFASTQPYHAIDDGRWAEKRIGPERIKTTYAFRSFLDAGVHLAFGSDWTVAPLDPLSGIYAAVTRRTIDGRYPDGWTAEQKITVEEALAAYTVSNAYGTYRERQLGRLAPGYLADLVLLSEDLTAIPPPEIDAVRVRATIVGGRVVFRQE
jgi:predicted amidohydrolase YtcJ